MANPRAFLAALRGGSLLLDSGMGTRLMTELDGRIPDSLPLMNITKPRVVWLNHQDDFDAGSDAVVANTFRADRNALEQSRHAGEFLAINRDGVALAREAAGPDRFVIGSIAPISGPDSTAAYGEQADILIRSGCDALMLETHTFEGAVRAFEALGEHTVPILASLWLWPLDAHAAARRLEDLGAAAIGTNCGDGLDDIIAATARLEGAVAIPLIAKPSAGKPGGTLATPEAFALAIPGLIASGARLIGGCCGTTPAHVSAMRGALGPRGDQGETASREIG